MSEEPIQSIAAIRYRYKNILIFLVLAFVGVTARYASDRLSDATFKHTLEILGDTLVIGCVAGLMFEFFLRRDMLAMMQEGQKTILGQMAALKAGTDRTLAITTACDTLGLERIFASDRDFQFATLVKTASSLTVVMNDGRTWFSSHETDFEERLSSAGKITRIFLIHPDSDYLKVLSRKVDTSVEEIKSKIDQTIRMLSRYAKKGHTLEIYGHFLPPSYSLVLSETDACQIPYPIGRKAERVPLFHFKKRDDLVFYASIERDIEVIKEKSSMLYPDRQQDFLKLME